MVRKTLGYVKLEWTCPQCGTRNPGPQKMCSSCGKPQPKRVAFHQPAEEKLITDEAEIARAKAGPDVHCAFCGARNPAGAARCTQCGADLDTATARESGAVLGAHRHGPAAPVTCPKCGASNDANALRCSNCNASLPRARPDEPQPTAREATPARPSRRTAARTSRSNRATAAKPGGRPAVAAKSIGKLGLPAILGIAAGVLLASIICVLVVLSMIPSKELVGEVRSVSWKRTIEIEELVDVTKEEWRDKIPPGSSIGTCTQKLRRTQDNPAPNATEVCGTPYTVDTGTGHGEVVQDCEYRVYDDWCTYTAREWQRTDTATLSGDDLYPRWPNVTLAASQREGERGETLRVVFDTKTKTYTYGPDDVDEFRQFQPGSRWRLKTNVLGGIMSLQPVR